VCIFAFILKINFPLLFLRCVIVCFLIVAPPLKRTVRNSALFEVAVCYNAPSLKRRQRKDTVHKESGAQAIPVCGGEGHQDISQSTFSVIQRRKSLVGIWYEEELKICTLVS